MQFRGHFARPPNRVAITGSIPQAVPGEHGIFDFSADLVPALIPGTGQIETDGGRIWEIQVSSCTTGNKQSMCNFRLLRILP
jgi:hypothetical protein